MKIECIHDYIVVKFAQKLDAGAPVARSQVEVYHDIGKTRTRLKMDSEAIDMHCICYFITGTANATWTRLSSIQCILH